MYLVDTNIFLEILLGQTKKEECERFLELLRKGKKSGIVTDFTIHSIMVTMYNFGNLNGLRIFLSSLAAYKGLRIYHTTMSDEVNATEFAVQNRLDIDDAIQYASALGLKAEAIVSFDKHFNNLKIARKEPTQIT